MHEWIEKLKVLLDNPENKKKITIGAVAGLVVLVTIIIVNLTTSSYPSKLHIDTVAVSLSERVKVIEIAAPYYRNKIQDKTLTFYRNTDGKTKWLEYRKPTKSYDAFVEAVQNSEQYGLDPTHYDLDHISKAIEKLYDEKDRTTDQVSDLDIRITGSFFLFTTHLIEGRIRTASSGKFIWKRETPDVDDIELLVENSSGNLYEIIDELHPRHEQYEKLRKALKQYRSLDVNRFDKVSAGVSAGIKPGEKHPAIPGIRKRLVLTDLEQNALQEDSMRYDEQLVEGVKQFQRRHGLTPDGIISETTSRYLNQSFEEKIDLIELNLERLRWLPREYGDDYISINVPEYLLRVYHNDKEKLEMRVVLGTEFNATPIFFDSLEYIVFNPTWTIPPGIMKNEVIPNLEEDPSHYDPKRFKIYKKGKEIDPEDEDWEDKDLDPADYKVVEDPGPNNSLGKVKFIMPNDFSIYLHDTPADHLFKNKKRAYSHGCIRVEKPVVLAEYLLRDQHEWNESAIEEAMKGIESKTVNLKKKYHVQIEYRTVWVDDEGLLHFREDLYGYDKRQLRLMNKLEESTF